MSETKPRTLAERLREEEKLEFEKAQKDKATQQLNETTQKYIEPLRTQKVVLEKS